MDVLPIYSEILLYNLVLLVGFVWFFYKYNKSELLLLIIVLFFGGLFMDIGNQLIGKIIFGSVKRSRLGYLIWQIGTLLWVGRYFIFHYPIKMVKKNKNIVIIFILYCISNIISTLFFNGDKPIVVIQELSKDLIPFALFLILASKLRDSNSVMVLNTLLNRLIIAQIVFTIFKFIILFRPYEGLVGSITGLYNGGPGTSLPLLVLLLMALNTNMNLKKKHLLLIVGLLFIGFMAGKRAVWLLFPILYIILSIYTYRRNFAKKILYVVVLVPIFFYFGLRLMPTLNPENVVWGSFDPEYSLNYGLKYSTGKRDFNDAGEEGYGRVGALLLVYERLTSYSFYSKNTLFGYGFAYFSNVSKAEYFDPTHWWGISGRGSITGVLLKYFSIGLIATVFYFIYIVKLILTVKNKRLKYTFLGVVLFDFIFYNATIITIPSLFVLLIFEILYANTQFIRKQLIN